MQPKTEVFIDIAKALGELGDSIIKIIDGIKHLMVTSEEGVSYILAKKTKNNLKELSACSTHFSAQQNVNIVGSFDDYLLIPSPMNWRNIKEHIKDVLSRGSALLSEWKNERSDFIVEESYTNLIESLTARLSILQKLENMEAPATESELNALKIVNEKYKKLIKYFKNAIKELNLYIKWLEVQRCENVR